MYMSALLKSESASTGLCYILFALGYLINRQEACFSWPPPHKLNQQLKKNAFFPFSTEIAGRGYYFQSYPEHFDRFVSND